MRLPFDKGYSLEKKMKKFENATDKKLGRMDESFLLMKNMLIELRKENEELRKDRQFLLDKLKGMLMELEKQKMQIRTTQMVLESEEQEMRERAYLRENPPKEAEAEPEEMRTEIEEGEKKETKSRHVERNVETPLDELLEFVIKKGSVRIIDAAKEFKVKEKQIEDWARILEEHDLIEVHYPTIGKPVLKKKH